MKIRQPVIFYAATFSEEWLAQHENSRPVQSGHPLSNRLKVCGRHEVVIATTVTTIEASFADAKRKRIDIERDGRAGNCLKDLVERGSNRPPLIASFFV